MKEKIGIITFHASHNYGSMLQAHALQQTVLGMGMDCEIINFRTKRQKLYYTPVPARGIVRSISYMIAFSAHLRALYRKHHLFEHFLHDEYILSAGEYSTLKELMSAELDYDCYISGSDQIWNTHCFDFDWAYYLVFVTKGRKIAYAPSMGPVPEIEEKSSNERRIREQTATYDHISVRERGTAERLEAMTGKSYPVAIDPTLLLHPSYWEKMAGDRPLVKGDYIFIYSPWYSPEVYEAAAALSRKTGLKVVQSAVRTKKELRNSRKNGFGFYLAAGPKEFLNLTRHAAYIVGGSFHVAVFAIMFKVPFYAVGGMRDSRVSSLLSMTGLEACGQGIPSGIDFDAALMKISEKRQKSLAWLRESLGINE